MREFVKLSPVFWSGKTGKELRKHGPDAQIMALYLMSNAHVNYVGLYRLPAAYISVDLEWTADRVASAMKAVEQVGFAKFDTERELVWVINGGAHQIGELKPNDKYVKAVEKEFLRMPACELTAAFFDKYRAAFHLPTRDDLAKFTGEKPADQAAAPSEPTPVSTTYHLPAGFAPRDERIERSIFAYAMSLPAGSIDGMVLSLRRLLARRDNMNMSREEEAKVVRTALMIADERGGYIAEYAVQAAIRAGDYDMVDAAKYIEESYADI